MTSTRAIAVIIVTAVTGSSAVVVGLVAGCGGNDSSVPGEGIGDATAEATSDARVVEGGDEGLLADSGSHDAADGAVAEAGDARMSTPDAGDAAGNDAASVPPLADFVHAYDTAYCLRLAQCCLLEPDQFNLHGANGCITVLDSIGGVFNVGDLNFAVLDSGLVAYNEDAAATCLQDISSFSCGMLSADAINQAQDVCLAATTGTLPIDAGPCSNSLECQTGSYCRIVGDAGSCTLLNAVGQGCADTTGSTDCSYLGGGTSGLYCARLSDGGAACADTLPLDAGCQASNQCQSASCDFPTCVASIIFSDPGVANGTCAYYTLPDAGGLADGAAGD